MLEKVADTERSRRLVCCSKCEHLFAPTMSCTKCGCFLTVKASFKVFKCPLGKWAVNLVDNKSN